jgi:hypothetical protein
MRNKILGRLFRLMRDAYRAEEDKAEMAIMSMDNDPSPFPEGMHFHIHDAENGKILRVNLPSQPSTAAVSGFANPRKKEEKIYIIPEGENVIEFVTRALVEERIK